MEKRFFPLLLLLIRSLRISPLSLGPVKYLHSHNQFEGIHGQGGEYRAIAGKAPICYKQLYI
jgi:hypothetical protein